MFDENEVCRKLIDIGYSHAAAESLSRRCNDDEGTKEAITKILEPEREEKPGYYAQIPSEVRYDEKLCANAKLLYGECTALANKHGYCYATNKYFAMLYEVSECTISRWISSLEKRCHVSIETVHNKGSRSSKERRIYIGKHLRKSARTSGKVLRILQEGLAQKRKVHIKDGIIQENNTRERTKTIVPQSVTGEDKTAEVNEIFEYWQTALNHPLGKLTPERRRAVLARLKDGYSKDDLLRAIDGCLASPHHMGQNDQGKRYDDLLLICRNGSKVEQFIGYKEAKVNGNGGSNGKRRFTTQGERYADIVAEYGEDVFDF